MLQLGLRRRIKGMSTLNMLGGKRQIGISKGCLAFNSKPNSTRNLWGVLEMKSQIWGVDRVVEET